jgi:hypothetical protein
MARKSLLEVTTAAAVAFPDNTAGEITPQILRTWIADLIGAIRPAYCYLSRIGPTAQTPPAGTPAALVFDSGAVSPVVDYTYVAATGTITRNEKGTCRFTFTADIEPTANANNLLTFTLYKNGVATAWKQSVMLTATGVIESVSLAAIEYLNGIGTYQMRISAAAATPMNFSNMTFVAETVPVWDYT